LQHFRTGRPITSIKCEKHSAANVVAMAQAVRYRTDESLILGNSQSLNVRIEAPLAA
jgi:hypothetical protein